MGSDVLMGANGGCVYVARVYCGKQCVPEEVIEEVKYTYNGEVCFNGHTEEKKRYNVMDGVLV